MKLTIIPTDGSVSEDGKFYDNLDLSSCNIPGDVHALQWDGVAGWIEFTSPMVQNEPIVELPAWASCCMNKWDQANNPPVPDPVPPTAEQNKATATNLLQKTDWTTIADVADPARSNPYLNNVQEFVDYRNAVRQYAVYPVSGFINWPTIPQEDWIKL